MQRSATVERITKETSIVVKLSIDGSGQSAVSTGIPFFDHMLTLFAVHGWFDVSISAQGDIDVDFHHTMEDVGLVLGEVFDQALGDRTGICRFGHASTPMDEALAQVDVDLSKRPYLVYRLPNGFQSAVDPFIGLVKEFLRAFSNQGGMNLHINVPYAENVHHMLEAVFKATARAMSAACALDNRLTGVLSSKGVL